MEPEGLLLYSQVPATCPYHEPDQSNPCNPSYFLKIHLNIFLPSRPGSPKWSLSLRFLQQNPVYDSPLPHSRYMPRPSHSCPRIAVRIFRNKIRFYGEELLPPRPTPKLGDHPLSAVRNCLVHIFAATLHIEGRSSIRSLRTRHFSLNLIIFLQIHSQACFCFHKNASM